MTLTPAQEDEIFVEEVLQRINEHDPSVPFFLFWAPHIVHAPLEVPQQYIDKFAWIDYQPRQHYMAMVNFLDDMVGRVVAALKAKGMWDNLLLISTADASTAQAALSPHPAALTRHPPIIPLPNQPSQNGGPIYQSGAAGANNWPLRGGKMSNWNGGIRINAYASGGLVPAARRGTIEEGLFHGCDAYATFCALAGVDPTDQRAAAAGLPPIGKCRGDTVRPRPTPNSPLLSRRSCDAHGNVPPFFPAPRRQPQHVAAHLGRERDEPAHGGGRRLGRRREQPGQRHRRSGPRARGRVEAHHRRAGPEHLVRAHLPQRHPVERHALPLRHSHEPAGGQGRLPLQRAHVPSPPHPPHPPPPPPLLFTPTCFYI